MLPLELRGKSRPKKRGPPGKIPPLMFRSSAHFQSTITAWESNAQSFEPKMAIMPGLNAGNALRPWRAECRPSLQDFVGCGTPVSGDVSYVGQFLGF
jgi:hypothetical protein